MGKYRKGEKKETPELATSSMADIVFMFLFFFMIVSNMRESDILVQAEYPHATAIQKLEKKSLVANINIGAPNDKEHLRKLGPEPRIQLSDQFAELRDVAQWIENEKQARDEADRQLMTWSLKVDKHVKMGIVTDVKQEMRQAKAYKVNYSTIPDLKKR